MSFGHDLRLCQPTTQLKGGRSRVSLLPWRCVLTPLLAALHSEAVLWFPRLLCHHAEGLVNNSGHNPQALLADETVCIWLPWWHHLLPQERSLREACSILTEHCWSVDERGVSLSFSDTFQQSGTHYQSAPPLVDAKIAFYKGEGLFGGGIPVVEFPPDRGPLGSLPG